MSEWVNVRASRLAAASSRSAPIVALRGWLPRSFRAPYLVESVEGGALLHELGQVLLPVELVGLRHGCSRTCGEERQVERGKQGEGLKSMPAWFESAENAVILLPSAPRRRRGSSENILMGKTEFLCGNFYQYTGAGFGEDSRQATNTAVFTY